MAKNPRFMSLGVGSSSGNRVSGPRLPECLVELGEWSLHPVLAPIPFILACVLHICKYNEI